MCTAFRQGLTTSVKKQCNVYWRWGLKSRRGILQKVWFVTLFAVQTCDKDERDRSFAKEAKHSRRFSRACQACRTDLAELKVFSPCAVLRLRERIIQQRILPFLSLRPTWIQHPREQTQLERKDTKVESVHFSSTVHRHPQRSPMASNSSTRSFSQPIVPWAGHKHLNAADFLRLWVGRLPFWRAYWKASGHHTLYGSTRNSSQCLSYSFLFASWESSHSFVV